MALICKLTVFFEDPFWVGLVEEQDGCRYRVARHVFGPEPTLPEIQQFALMPWDRLRFTDQLPADPIPERRMNPKRKVRLARKEAQEVAKTCRGTLSQQALSRHLEEGKAERQHLAAQAKQRRKDERFKLQSQKRKEKRRGH